MKLTPRYGCVETRSGGRFEIARVEARRNRLAVRSQNGGGHTATTLERPDRRILHVFTTSGSWPPYSTARGLTSALIAQGLRPNDCWGA